MNLLTDNNTNFVELEENVLNEVNGGLPWRAIGKLAVKGTQIFVEGIAGGAAWYAGEKITH